MISLSPGFETDHIHFYVSGNRLQEVSPACFGHMTGLLAQQGVPLVLLLEGGYFLPSLAQGALHCMQALLQRVKWLENFCKIYQLKLSAICIFRPENGIHFGKFLWDLNFVGPTF